MIIIPAIDIRRGRCVRLIQGDAAREFVYADDPVAMARRWMDEGARWLHIVDLDGAFSGHPVHLDLLRAIATAIPVPIQAGGGFRTLDDIADGLLAGAARIIVGSAAPALAEEAARRFGDRVAVAIDVKAGHVAVAGWTAVSAHEAVPLGRALVARGIRRFIYTDVSRDGTMIGPNLKALRAFVRAVPAPVIAAGGIASPADLAALERAGVEGAVMGRALYEGRLNLTFLMAGRAQPC
ncbi:MAG: 1-(5-phosphoribosyl)-5-[(5-phosphoribosylamino)methylideneamino]imidazole-4-carboxamide isomerase [Armatimonadetes bacterium]|nr:1-(5-phosphoribosyl)-5-[(5-phosphoribosylamino)methylideneamino]imidazole-4-carboxamide isomerase [Armatimonadota bacterium]